MYPSMLSRGICAVDDLPLLFCIFTAVHTIAARARLGLLPSQQLLEGDLSLQGTPWLMRFTSKKRSGIKA